MRFCNLTKTLIGLYVFLFGISLFARPVLAEVSFEGKRIILRVGHRVGGGTDRAARLVGLFLPKYLPGKPKIIMQNMPGGEGTKAANYFATQVKPDGLLIEMGGNSELDHFRMKTAPVRFDPSKFEFLGGLNRGGSVIMVRKDARKRLTDRSAKPVIVGAVTGNRTWNAMVLWSAEYLGWNVKWVVGYRGGRVLLTAMRQGEIELTSNSSAFAIREMVNDGVADLITQTGTFSKGKFHRRSSLMELPTFVELLGDKKPKGLAWEAYLAWVRSVQVDKWIALPPGTPREIVQVHQLAFEKVVKDPEFLRLAKKQLSIDITATTREDVKSLIKDLVDTPEEANAYIFKIKKKYGLPTR